jgi:Fe-S oxidoreductase
MPRLVNFVGQAPIIRDLVKWAAGIAPKRKMPQFANETFKEWFFRRPPRNLDKPPVILWPDTFNNHFHPQVARAAVEVLERAGLQVIVPRASLCCGRPLYDFGMLTTAKRLLRQILTALKPAIEAGIPVVGLEPSCVAVFRDELTNLFPGDEDAKRLCQQTFLLSEFLNRKVPDFQPPKLKRKAIVHGHCHHKAVMKMDDERAMLDKVGLEARLLDSGCCGMAGSFGFERGHYDVSVAVGELVLLPEVRNAADDELIVANGFSCREQIAQLTSRRAMHLAEVIQMAYRQQPDGAPPDYSTNGGGNESKHQRKLSGRLTATMVAAGLGGLAAGVFLSRTFLNRSRR